MRLLLKHATFVFFFFFFFFLLAGLSMSLEIMQGPENITVAVETETALHCVVHGSPTPKIQWFKDNQMLPNTSRWDLHDDGQLLVFE